MAEKFLMPKLSPTMEEGQISRWVKNEGDNYEAGETLAEVDTDKATMEMTALSNGTLLKILKGAGEGPSWRSYSNNRQCRRGYFWPFKRSICQWSSHCEGGTGGKGNASSLGSSSGG